MLFNSALLTVALLSLANAGRAPAAAAAISGTIEDASGAALVAATIEVVSRDTAGRWTATTDARGRYRVPALAPGAYRLTASAPGFATASRHVSVALGETIDVPFRLAVSGVTASVQVSASLDLVDVSRTQTADAIMPREVRELPSNGRNYLDLALLAPGVSRTNAGTVQRFAETSAVPGSGISVSGQRNLNNTFVVDGLSANDDAAGLAGSFFSQEAVREFQVVSSGAVAEFGRSSSGVINVVTQSGTNDRRGAAYAYVRDDRLDARNPLLPSKDPLSQRQAGVSFGGPLQRDRTFIFANVERTDQTRAGAVTIAPEAMSSINAVLAARAPSMAPIATGDFPATQDSTLAFARADRQESASTHVAVRYSLYDLSSLNARNAGGLNAASRGAALRTLDQTLAAAVSRAGVWLNELRVQATRSRLTSPVNDPIGPAVNIAGAANFGTATFSPTARALDVYQIVDAATAQAGAHLLKAGADVLYNRVTIEFPGPVQGVYTYSSPASFGAGRYITFQQAFGRQRQFQSNPNLGVFLQDEWRVAGALTLSGGVRYDVQWLPGPIATDRDNISPRLGFAWAPGHRRTVVRGSAGVYFDRIPLRATSNALQRDGTSYRTAVLPFGTAGAPAFPHVLDAFPDGLLTAITTIDPGIESTSSRQVAAAVEQAVGRHSSIALRWQYAGARGLIMSRNVNVPAPVRPDPRFANISRYESIGRSRYRAVTASWRTQARLVDARLSYTFSRAWDDAGNFFFFQPQDANDVRADWGPSDNDQRHRLTASGTWRWGGWQLSGIASYASALPFNVQTGTDRNGDTNVNDRPAGVGRNSARGFNYASVDVRLARRIAVPHATAELTLDTFNLLNRANFAVPNNIYGSGATPLPAFGRATAALDARQIQLGARLSF